MAVHIQRLRQNLDRIRQRIDVACIRSGRPAGSVRLIAVTKYAELEWVRALVELGVTDLGESRPQQLADRAEQLAGPIHWNLIGQLQRNKVRKVLPLAHRIHSIDSLKLLAAVDRIAQEEQLKPRLLLEVNVSGETSKSGFTPADLLAAWKAVADLENVEVAGLMTMAPDADDSEVVRPVFRQLRELRDRIVEASGNRLALTELSMGMSNDFEVAIEEGSTMVRIGTSLWEGVADEW